MQVALTALGVPPEGLDVATRIMDALCTLNGSSTDATVIQAIATSRALPIRTGDVKLLLNQLKSCVRITRSERTEKFACTFVDLRAAAEAELLRRREAVLADLEGTGGRGGSAIPELSRAAARSPHERHRLDAARAELERVDRALQAVRVLDKFVP